MDNCLGGKMSRSSRDNVVFPDEEGPDMPTKRGGGDMTVTNVWFVWFGEFHNLTGAEAEVTWGLICVWSRVHPSFRSPATCHVHHSTLLSQPRNSILVVNSSWLFVMEPSPLTQVSRPELFQPKIISLYETLFKVRVCLLRVNIIANLRCRKMRKTSSLQRASGRSSFCTVQIQPA